MTETEKNMFKMYTDKGCTIIPNIKNMATKSAGIDYIIEKPDGDKMFISMDTAENYENKERFILRKQALLLVKYWHNSKVFVFFIDDETNTVYKTREVIDNDKK